MKRLRSWAQSSQGLTQSQRDRLWAIVLLLGILGSLPEPAKLDLRAVNILMLTTWIAIGILSTVLFFAPAWTGLGWVLCVALSLLAFLKLKTVYPLAMLILWGIWFWFR